MNRKKSGQILVATLTVLILIAWLPGLVGTCMDVLEIDAASNNGVDNVRDLRDDAIYAPSQVKKRVYIIDEVHMLSISAPR